MDVCSLVERLKEFAQFTCSHHCIETIADDIDQIVRKIQMQFQFHRRVLVHEIGNGRLEEGALARQADAQFATALLVFTLLGRGPAHGVSDLRTT